MLTIRDITVRIAGRVLLENASATVSPGHRIGLIGRNGTGKSTLLKVIAGELQTDSGEVKLVGDFARPNSFGWVKQEAPGGPETPIEHVLAADVERASLLDQAEHETDPNRIAEIQTRLVDIDAHVAPARAARILAGLGFDEEMQNQPLSSYSGGWRMRVALAAVLFQEPELLLLDEPTNHLDLETTIWLEAHLRAYPKAMIIVSHDRDMLNSVVTGLIHVETQTLIQYTGDYDTFEREREQRLAQIEAQRGKQDARRAHLQSFVDRFRYKASKARQAQSRLKMLEKMEVLPNAVSEPETRFQFPVPDELAPPLLSFEKASFGYTSGKPVLSHVDMRLDPDDRIGLLGANGNGKTTLARLIAGELKFQGGEEHRASKLRVGYVAQHHAEELDPNDTPIEHLSRRLPAIQVDRVRSRLGSVGLIQTKQTTQVGKLSGGEKARLSLALVMADDPHVLVLDEPTNHLDIDARGALVNALNDFPGAVVLISHDRRLVELTVDRLWLVADGTVKTFDGDLAAYRDYIRVDRRGDGKAKARSEDGGKNKKDQRRDKAEARRLSAEARKTAKEAERKLERLIAERDSLVAKLGDQGTYSGSTSDLQKMIHKKAELDAAVDKAEEIWLKAAEVLEGADA
ncbi:MAG: ATP-binding cassette domain-containing protein [Alphaproteobacteria bacterium]|nr:ATP-binding cassette domain-containing protein [Alphaproteobacteria bacterium]